MVFNRTAHTHTIFQLCILLKSNRETIGTESLNHRVVWCNRYADECTFVKLTGFHPNMVLTMFAREGNWVDCLMTQIGWLQSIRISDGLEGSSQRWHSLRSCVINSARMDRAKSAMRMVISARVMLLRFELMRFFGPPLNSDSLLQRSQPQTSTHRRTFTCTHTHTQARTRRANSPTRQYRIMNTIKLPVKFSVGVSAMARKSHWVLPLEGTFSGRIFSLFFWLFLLFSSYSIFHFTPGRFSLQYYP